VPFVVVALNRLPVVAPGAALLDRLMEPPSVVADGRLGHSEPSCYLGTRQAASEQLGYEFPGSNPVDRDGRAVVAIVLFGLGLSAQRSNVVSDRGWGDSQPPCDLVGGHPVSQEIRDEFTYRCHEHMFAAGSAAKRRPWALRRLL
jgi:hypothetical protein